MLFVDLRKFRLQRLDFARLLCVFLLELLLARLRLRFELFVPLHLLAQIFDIVLQCL